MNAYVSELPGVAEVSAYRQQFAEAWIAVESIADAMGLFRQYLVSGADAVAAEYSAQEAAKWAGQIEYQWKRLGKYPHLRGDLEARLLEIAKEKGMGGAVKWFRSFELEYLRLGGTLLTVESHDQSIKQEAEALAAKSERAILDEVGAVKARGAEGKYCMATALRLVKAICAGAGLDVPEPGEVADEKAEIAALVMRLADPKWWRRQLRTLQARKLEAAARDLGAVCKRRGGYCSVMTLRRRYGQKRRNRELLESLEAENESGQVYSLAELSDLGVSNPVNRRAELMTRIRGFEEWAGKEGGWSPVFITQTCPSRYHSHNRAGVVNPYWDGSTPRDAQAYLSDVWAKVRATWDREKIPAFGMRVAEPHHDGCPHWHLLMWFPAHQIDKALAIYQGYAMADAPPAPGRESVRFKAMRDELAKGATSYIAKYISKNVDGLTVDGDAWSADVVKTALRTEAWASTWGIRQFQQVGGASVTVWREVRRLRQEQMDAKELEAVRAAADAGDWCGYTEAMGGAVMRRVERPLRAMMVRKAEAGAMVKNAYGEFMRKIQGLMAWDWLPITTRFFEWVIRPIKRAVESVEIRSGSPLDLCQ